MGFFFVKNKNKFQEKLNWGVETITYMSNNYIGDTNVRQSQPGCEISRECIYFAEFTSPLRYVCPT